MPQQSTAQAAIWMGGWLVNTLALSVAGRELGHDIPVFVTMIFRSVIAVAILTPIVLYYGGFSGRFTNLRLNIVRNIVHYGAQYSWFMALALIPLAQVVAIEFTMPIWGALIAALFLGEKLNRFKLTAIALGFVGILLIVKPGTAHIDEGHAVALLAAVGFAISVAMTKIITRTDSALTVIFLMFLIQTVIGAVPAYLVWKWPEPHNWVWVAVVALAGTFSHYCLSKAISLADMTIVTPLDFLRVPLTVLVGYWIYREGFDFYSIIGTLLILGANTLNLFKARQTA
ncbi:DMT family transporter [Taklimakanibacter deserti]|uniref:DMT family transporter n=1 Tax=Taklimakanibacter deserti TaxID=2267839 RepID=UPI0034D6CC94